MEVTQTRVSQIERAEVAESIQLSTLRRAAEALNCRLVYALVPEVSLEDMVMRQAFLKAKEDLVDVVFGDSRDAPELVEETMSEQQEELALNWGDRRGLWAKAGSQLAANAGPSLPGPPPESWGGAP